jgi:anti-sigma regulatory factor (Ser/Thr protein kinase)
MNRVLRLDLTVPADWNRIDRVREVVAGCLGTLCEEDEVADALSMVSAELLENAIKYGDAARPEILFSLALRAEPAQLVVTVANTTGGDPRNVHALHSRIAWLQGFSSPAEAYVAALGDLYNRADSTIAGGLGLVRVAHEGGCTVAIDASDPGWVRVCASRALAAAEPASGS